MDVKYIVPMVSQCTHFISISKTKSFEKKKQPLGGSNPCRLPFGNSERKPLTPNQLYRDSCWSIQACMDKLQN